MSACLDSVEDDQLLLASKHDLTDPRHPPFCSAHISPWVEACLLVMPRGDHCAMRLHVVERGDEYLLPHHQATLLDAANA